MNTRMAKSLSTLVKRALVIAIFSSLAGVLFNMVAPRGIPFVYHPPLSVKLSAGEARVADISEAFDAFQRKAAVFIDARSADHYRKGRIEGALSLPAYDADSALESVLSALSPEQVLITYCSGVECDESHRVADILMQCGYQNVMIFAEGFPAWQKAGYSVETGDGRRN